MQDWPGFATRTDTPVNASVSEALLPVSVNVMLSVRAPGGSTATNAICIWHVAWPAMAALEHESPLIRNSLAPPRVRRGGPVGRSPLLLTVQVN
jgi:hypothetical protein